MKKFAFILPLLSGVCFGSIGIFIRLFSEAGFNNMAILATRNAISAMLLFLFLFAYDRELLKCRVRDLPVLLGGGFIEAGKASILTSSEPVAAMLFGAFVYGEKLTVISVIGMAVAVTAFGIISTGKGQNAKSGQQEKPGAE